MRRWQRGESYDRWVRRENVVVINNERRVRKKNVTRVKEMDEK